MIDVLRDSVWPFVGALLGLIAIGVSVWVYWAQRSRKRILIETVARIPLVTLGAKGIPGLRIIFNDRPVENASVSLVRIQNIGNVPILASDIEQPISLEFEEGATILNADIGETNPKHLPIEIAFSERTLQVGRHLLNPGDTFTSRVLIESSKGKFIAKARIAGVLRLERRGRVSLVQPILGIATLVVVVAAFYFSPTPRSTTPLDIRSDELPYLLVAVLATLAFSVITVRELRSRIRKLRERFVLLGANDT